MKTKEVLVPTIVNPAVRGGITPIQSCMLTILGSVRCTRGVKETFQKYIIIMYNKGDIR